VLKIAFASIESLELAGDEDAILGVVGNGVAGACVRPTMRFLLAPVVMKDAAVGVAEVQSAR